MTAIAGPRFLLMLGLVSSAGLFAACSQRAQPEPAPARSIAAEQADPAAVAPFAPAARDAELTALATPDEPVTGDATLWLDPLASCEGGQVSTLHLSDALLAKGPVEVRFGELADGPLFAQVGEPGSKQTGPWLAPGAVFIARLGDGTEVARAVAKGPGCEGRA